MLGECDVFFRRKLENLTIYVYASLGNEEATFYLVFISDFVGILTLVHLENNLQKFYKQDLFKMM